MVSEKDLYRPEEVAERLGFSRARVYQLLAAGEIFSVKIGASRRVPATDLSAYVARIRAEQGGGPAVETPATVNLAA